MQVDRPELKLGVLGPLIAVDGSERLNLGGPKQRTVLALLIANAGEAVRADAIEAAVYGEQPPDRVRRIVQTYVSTLRATLGDVIRRSGDGWRLDVDRSAIDANEFEDLHNAARNMQPDRAAVALTAALDLWRGSPYIDVDAHGALGAERSRLNELRLAATHARFEANLNLGRHREVVGELDATLIEHPLHEGFRAQHMLVLYRSGRQADALASYTNLRHHLAEQLGLNPSQDLQELERRILDHDPSLKHTPTLAFTTDPLERTAPTPLPLPLTPILGRDNEIRRTQELLSRSRLVTLVGVGGSGKTRLALEVAAQEQTTLDCTVYFVDLNVISHPDDVTTAIAEATRLAISAGNQIDGVAELLADEKALVVLDNCEHVVDACAEILDALLRRPGVWRVLATSRELIGIDGEQVMPVPPLATGRHEAAFELFVARAQALDPNLIIDDDMTSAVAELCERLDGLPLAIELAAARTLVMSPSELIAHLDDGIGVLKDTRARSAQTHPTIHATLDWSFNLLDSPQQHMLMCLGVFRGAFDVAAAAAVSELDQSITIDILDSLVGKSLVVAGSHYGRRAFHLLEVVRSYAVEQLNQSGGIEGARGRHVEYHRHTVSDADRRQWRFLQPNLEAAIDAAMELGQLEAAVDLFTASTPLWHENMSVRPAIDRLDRLVEQLPPRSSLRERLLLIELQFALGVRDDDRIVRLAKQASHVADPEIRIPGLMFLTNAYADSDPDEALRLADVVEQSAQAELLENHDAREWLAKARSDVAMLAGNHTEALAILEPVMERGRAGRFDSAATMLYLDGRPAEALNMLITHEQMLTEATFDIGLLAGLCHLDLGHHDQGRQQLLAKAERSARGRWLLDANDALIGLAALAHEQGNDALAASLIPPGRYRWWTTLALARHIARRIGFTDALEELQNQPRRDQLVKLRAALAAHDW